MLYWPVLVEHFFKLNFLCVRLYNVCDSNFYNWFFLCWYLRFLGVFAFEIGILKYKGTATWEYLLFSFIPTSCLLLLKYECCVRLCSDKFQKLLYNMLQVTGTFYVFKNTSETSAFHIRNLSRIFSATGLHTMQQYYLNAHASITCWRLFPLPQIYFQNILQIIIVWKNNTYILLIIGDTYFFPSLFFK